MASQPCEHTLNYMLLWQGFPVTRVVQNGNSWSCPSGELRTDLVFHLASQYLPW